MVKNNSSRGNIPITVVISIIVVVLVRGALRSSTWRILVATGTAQAAIIIAAGIETGCGGRHAAVVVAASPTDAAIDAAAAAGDASSFSTISASSNNSGSSRSSGLLLTANKLAKSSTRSTFGRLYGRRVLVVATAIDIASGRIIKFKTRSLIGKIKDQIRR